MTAKTKRNQVILQEMLGFGRGMWLVAVHTSLFHRVMLEFYLGNGIADILMTFQTEGISFFKEEKFIIVGMRVMAFYTIAIHHNFMTAFGILGDNSFMALIADFVRIFVQ
jgi:hypothetical protein